MPPFVRKINNFIRFHEAFNGSFTGTQFWVFIKVPIETRFIGIKMWTVFVGFKKPSLKHDKTLITLKDGNTERFLV